jgi:hypothetical protein
LCGLHRGVLPMQLRRELLGILNRAPALLRQFSADFKGFF